MHFTIETLTQYLQEVYPQTAETISIEALIPMEVVVRMSINNDDLRPGNTVSGPTVFTVADCAFYCALLAMIGPKVLAVTSNISINFMRKPKPVALVGHARILKLGKTFAMGDCTVYSQGKTEAVAQATITYAIPTTVSPATASPATADGSAPS